MVEVMKIMVTSFKRSHAHIATLSAPNHATGHWRPTPMPETPDKASLGQSLVESLSLSSGSWCTQSFFLCPPRVCFPSLVKFWQFYGCDTGHLFQEGLCHTQVLTQSQSPCPQSSVKRWRSGWFTNGEHWHFRNQPNKMDWNG